MLWKPVDIAARGARRYALRDDGLGRQQAGVVVARAFQYPVVRHTDE
ncbi:MAG: hypothetical protein IID42_06245 [Planctomycetes bacterium]|nr:hypothetical protein [Planctomycetota bacterium]